MGAHDLPIVFLVVLFCGGHHVGMVTSQVCPTTTYEKTQNARLRRTTLLDGDYIILSLMTNSDGGSCENITLSGLVRVLGFQYALESINNKSEVLPRLRLGYQIDDACYNIPVAVSRSIEAFSLHRPNSPCRTEQQYCAQANKYNAIVKPISAVVGTWYSFTSIPVASLMSVYKIPQVSDGASSLLLSNKAVFSSFFRTIPSDVNQVEAMLDLMNYFGWKYIFLVGADDDYGRLAITELKLRSAARNICVSHDEYLPYQTSNVLRKSKEIVALIKETEHAKVVVLFTYAAGNGEYILREAELQGVQRLWITSDSWSPDALSLNVSRRQLENIISLSVSSTVLPDFRTYVQNSIVNSYSCNPWIRNYIELTFSCHNLTLRDGSFVGETCSRVSNCKRCVVPASDVLASLSPDSFWQVNNLIDAVYAVAYAINASLLRACGNSSWCPNVTTVLSPADILDGMKGVSFTNLRGNVISFDKNGDPMYVTYAICQLAFGERTPKMLKFATWKKVVTAERLFVNESLFKWPPWVMPTPLRSTCSSDCQPGQYVVGKSGCCWACRNCEGTDSVSSEVNAAACSKCPLSHHTIDNIHCVRTPKNHLNATHATGIAILVISSVGITITLVTFVALLYFWKSGTVQISSPLLHLISLVILILAFVYGTLHLAMPSRGVCRLLDGTFYPLLVLFPSILFVRTIRVKSALSKMAFKNRAELSQVSLVLCLLAVQVTIVLVWGLTKSVDIELIRLSDFELWLQCEARLSTFRVVVTLIAVAVLLAATVIAFQERRKDHPQNEPKYLFFAGTAMCIVTASYIPALNFVVGGYKSAVLAVTQAAYGFIFISCLLIPMLCSTLLEPVAPLSDSCDTPVSVSKEARERHSSSVPYIEYDSLEFRDEYTPSTVDRRKLCTLPDEARDIDASTVASSLSEVPSYCNNGSVLGVLNDGLVLDESKN